MEATPEGYNTPIDDLLKKMPEIRSLLDGFLVEGHTCDDVGYDYLEGENCLAIVVKNSNSENDLFVDLAGECTLSFAQWHSHYSPYEYDFKLMLADIQSILHNDLCAVVAYSADDWLGSRLMSGDVINMPTKTLLKNVMKGKEARQKIASIGGRVEIIFWNPDFNRVSAIPSSNK